MPSVSRPSTAARAPAARSVPEHAIATVSAWFTSAFALSTTTGGRSSTRSPATKAPSVTASGIRVIGHLGAVRDDSATGRHRLVRPQKRAHLVDRLLEQVLRLSPGKYRRLGLRRERGNVHGRLIGVRRRVVRHHEEWRLAGSDELPRHAVHEVRAYAIEAVQIGFDALRGDLRPSGPQLGAPDIAPGVVHDVGILRPMPDRLAQHGGHDAVGGSLDELQPERSPDAVAHVEELLHAEVVHQPPLVVREGAPGVAGGNRPRGFAAVRIALIHRDAAEVALERFHRVEDRGGPVAHAGVQAPAGSDEQREARASHLVADAEVTLLIERHGGLLRHLTRCPSCGRTTATRGGDARLALVVYDDGPLDARGDYRLTAKTQITPPCGTSVLEPRR